MNLHMAQDPEAESELRNLAAVPYQIISPGNNAPIIGIYQDSMLGSYRFTRENINFTHKEAMNLLMMFDRVNPIALTGGKSSNDRVSNFEVLSQILPPLSIKVKNKQFDGEKENIGESNNVIEIKDGRYLRGQMDKGILGSGTKGLIHRVCNSFGNMASAKFIDDLQNIVTEYMKQSSFSVGISDLITSANTNAKIISIITDKKADVKKLIDQVQVGVFENSSGKTNEEEFETKINNLLGKAQSEAGREALKNLSKDNRFVIMFNAGSKGTEINIQQMTACLGQQNVDGKRIPYGFEHRTLPHYTKYDDSPVARGFVESSYINGLSPQEVFFHAMGGRIGLIDTAVKSVVSNTPIVIIENGEPKYVEIGKWIDNQLDNCATPEDIQHFTERRMELLNTANIYIPTTDENGIVTWGEVTAVTRHDPGTALYEIKTIGGRSVIVTESKSLLIWNPETKKLVETLTPEIIVGDCVPVTAELCEPPIIKESIDMSVYLSKTKYVFGTEFNTAIQMMEHEMEERVKIPAGWWDENNGLNFVLPYSKKASLQRTLIRSNVNNIKSGFIYPYHAARKETYISEQFELNEENGIFIGLFLAEGNAYKNTVTITNLDDNIIAFMKNWFDKNGICSTEQTRINKIGGTTRTIRGNSSILSTFITNLVGSGAANKYVPTEAFIAPRAFVKGLLNGYYSGDGTISKNSVDVGSASSRLIEGIAMLCSRFGIFGKVFKTQMKSNNLGTKNIKPTYRLSIRAQWGRKFAETISLIDDKKMKKMSGIKWNTNHRNFETYNDIVLDKIVEINIVGVEKYPKVYDLTIPSTLNFGLANGLQVRDTSTTGYIQRRLIKGMEDLMVNYDMTVRSSKGKVVQFSYGDDGIDTIKVENQEIPIVDMTIQDIYAHFNVPEDDKGKSKALSGMFVKSALTRQKKQEEQINERCKKYTDYMIENRGKIIKNIFNFKSDKVVHLPVAFMHIIQNVMGQQNVNPNSLVDITMLEAFEVIEETFDSLLKIRYAQPTELFRVMYFYYLSPKDLLLNKRFNKKALDILLQTIVLDYKRSIVAPGEMVGMIAAQSIGEPTTQMCQRYCERIRCAKINKNTKMISMVSGPIGELCDGLIEANPDYTFNTGHVDSVETLLDALEDEYYIIGVDGQEKTHWNKISHVSRHPVNGNMMKIVTKTGRVVHTTTSHSHLIRKNQTVVPITGADLKEGMRIPVAKHIDNTFVNEFVTIGSQDYKLDYLFGWFVGAYLAEGHLTKKTGSQDVKGTINITNISEHFIDQTKQFAARFGKECRLNTTPGEYGPGTTTIFTCKILADLLLSSCNNGSFVKHLPDFAFLAPLEFKAGLIQAYMDGDGNFQSDDKHHQIRCCSRSKQLAKDIALMLNYFDMFATINENFVRGSIMYNLAIPAKYAKQYEDKIGSLVHTDKLMNLVKYCERTDVHSLSDDIDKITGLGEIVAKCGKVLKLPGQSRNYGRWAKKDSIGRRTLEKYIEIFETSENAGLIAEELQILKQATSSGVIWDEIVNIEIYNLDPSEYVYDFTVPANQTFMTDYGVIVHNTLNTFHFAGIASKSNVTRGVPRIEEILSLSASLKNPSLTVFLKPEDETDRDKASTVQYMLEHTRLEEIVKSIEICFDPDDLNTMIDEDKNTMSQFREFETMVAECMNTAVVDDSAEKSKWIIRIIMDAEVMLEKNITMDDINFTLNNVYKEEISCVYSDYNADKLVFRIRMKNIIDNAKSRSQKKAKLNPLDQSDQIYILKNFQDTLLNNIVLRGVKNINKVILRKIKDNLVEKSGAYIKKDIWVLDTIGTNMLDVLGLDYIDPNRTYSNDIIEIFNVLGMEAARSAIYNELAEVLEFDGAYVNAHHMTLLCDRITFNYKMVSIFRHGINNDDIGPIAKASFEETPEMFLKAARHAELDTMRGISANVMCGQEGLYGTAAFQVVLDLNEMINLEENYKYEYKSTEDIIDETLFAGLGEKEEICSKRQLEIETNVSNLKMEEMGKDNDYDPFA